MSNWASKRGSEVYQGSLWRARIFGKKFKGAIDEIQQWHARGGNAGRAGTTEPGLFVLDTPFVVCPTHRVFV